MHDIRMPPDRRHPLTQLSQPHPPSKHFRTNRRGSDQKVPHQHKGHRQVPRQKLRLLRIHQTRFMPIATRMLKMLVQVARQAAVHDFRLDLQFEQERVRIELFLRSQ